MSTADPRRWPTIERTELIDAMIVESRAHQHRGVILCGEAGVGKTTAAQQLARTRGGEVITIRGGDVMSSVPYGALFGVLSDLGAGDAQEQLVEQPERIAGAFAAAIEQRSSGGTPTVILDNAALLDQASAFLISQLAERMHLIVIVPALGDVPDPLLELWRDGVLGVHEVAPLSSEAVAELMTRYLEGPIALSSATALAEATGGNPLFLSHLVAEQIAAGTLVQHEGIWVLERQAELQDQRLADLMRLRLNRWSPAQRNVLEIVALTDSVSLELLAKLVDTDDLESLLSDGVLQVEPHVVPTVRVRHRHIAAIIRLGVSFLQRRLLRERVVAADVDGTLTATTEGVVAFAAWTLSCGAPLEPAIALRAATAANDMYDPEFALRLAAAVVDDAHSAAAAVEKSRAWRLLGLPASAVAVLTSVDDNADLTAHNLVELAAEWVANAHQVEGQAPAAQRMLDAAQHAMDAEQSAAALQARLDIARWDFAAGSGDHVHVLTELEDAASDTGEPGGDRRIAARSVLAAAYALVGRQHDAVNLVHQGSDQERATASHTVRDLEHAARFEVLLRCASFTECLETLARERDDRALQMLYYGSATDSAAATVLLHAGRAREAVPLLHSALAQLRVRDVRATAGQIFAGLAYASALVGESARARAYLAEYGAGRHTYWHTMSSASYMALSAQALVGDRDEAVAAMISAAAEHRDAGRAMEELQLLAAAARNGSSEALQRISASTIEQPGVRATHILTWAAARSSADAAALLSCAQTLLAGGNLVLALDAAREAARMDPTSRSTAAVIADVETRMGIATDAPTTVLDMLTKRERDVAERAASGDTNRDIAEALFLSVRTVESYLQTVYGKLGVKGRSGLQQLLA